MLNPVGWETHVAPEMGNHPQVIINKRILDDADILIGIFWTRLGTETGEYASGTVEEITKHISSEKLTSIYICDKPIPPSQITEQYQKLQVQVREWMPSGVLNFYNDLLTFKQSIKNHLSIHISQHEYIRSLLTENATSSRSNGVSEKISIEPSDEMKQILLNAGEHNDDVQFLELLDGVCFHVGKLDFKLNEGRELAKWQAALKELVKLNLLIDRGSKGQLFSLTDKGWEAFDQLKAQISEKE
ncbi:DUF4062 domain-containing protein [Acinetobacter sp. YH16032]|uniref:DUF4062 domain-containing protein n=1 Tax=Acinetobacter sp. YH16032 TaxID=2601181 RepID=UPI00211DAAA0|nr:DUF4062 domain-containing protein [Acinetobacter sp. YH16032]